MQQHGGAGDDFGALGIARALPGGETGRGRRKLALKLRIADVVEGFFQMVVEWVDTLIGHFLVLFRYFCTRGYAPAEPPRPRVGNYSWSRRAADVRRRC